MKIHGNEKSGYKIHIHDMKFQYIINILPGQVRNSVNVRARENYP